MRKSIRMRVAVLFAAAVLSTAALVFFAYRFSMQITLRRTTRDYLWSAVEENTTLIRWSEERPRDPENTVLPAQGGWLEVDRAFLDVMNDVRTALYDGNGRLLYGDDPLVKRAAAPVFESSGFRTEEAGGVRYIIYDRRLVPRGMPGDGEVWLRGAVSDEAYTARVREATRMALAFLPGVLLFAAIVGWAAADRLVSPLRRMEETAAAISGGMDLKRRIDGENRQDEIGRLAEAFNGMIGRLEKAFSTERQFTADASHELRTPTSVIIAQCESVLDHPVGGEPSSEEYEAALRTIRRQGKRMNALIADLLDCARLDRESAIPSREVEIVDLSALTREVASEAAMIAPHGTEVELRAEDGIYTEGTPLLLIRMLEKLTDNAFRYGGPDGRVIISLKKGTDEARGFALLSVEDSGPGIPPEQQEKIFDRFYRVDSSRTVPGSGLGLSISRQVARLHGGDLTVRSVPGEGAVFTISLPLADPDSRFAAEGNT